MLAHEKITGVVGDPLFDRVFHPNVVRNPVDFPRLATIVRKRLLEMARIGRDLGDDESNKDGTTIQSLLIEEFATPVGKPADGRLCERSAGAVGEVETPLMRLRIVQTEVESFEVTRRPVSDELDEIGAPVPYPSHNRGPFVCHPRAGTSQWTDQSSEVCLPGADFEVEVVRSVARLPSAHATWTRLRRAMTGQCDDVNAAQEKRQPSNSESEHHNALADRFDWSVREQLRGDSDD